MPNPRSGFIEGEPRLHYLEWNSRSRRTLVLLHGNSANAWWWQPMASAIDAEYRDYRMIAVDLRGHGDSEWVRPPNYSPGAYATDLTRVIAGLKLDRPVVAGHSMGGIVVLDFVSRNPEAVRAAIAIDVAVTSSARRNRYLSRLRALPTVSYPDLRTALSRFRLMPAEGDIPAEIIAQVASHSVGRAPDGRYAMKFDRESFFGSDGIDVPTAIYNIRTPLLLVRGDRSRIMTAEAADAAATSNPRAELVTIPGHHHLPLENPAGLGRTIFAFAEVAFSTESATQYARRTP
jgi:pimeloyl-ACP methyl ester carboxylesterase